ncbi:MAG: hypothetical protein U9Q07_05590 [Planctomycetota bacterium]|nr:hypothetical protein [Planctomycetota bacterium]
MAVTYIEGHSNVAAKAEATEGTAIALTATEANIMAGGLSYDPDLPFHERNIVAVTPDQFSGVTGFPRLATISMEIPMVGSGTAGTAPAWGVLLQAMGFSESISAGTSVTYVPAIAPSSLTLAWWVARDSTDGLKMQIHGARGRGSIQLPNGGIPLLQCEFQGVWDVPVDDTLLSPTYYTTSAVAVNDSSFALDSVGMLYRDFSINIDNEMGVRDDPTDTAGALSVALVRQKINGSIDPQMDNPSTYDFFTKTTGGTESTLSLVTGSSAGNILTITAPKVSYKEPKVSPRDGYLTAPIGLHFARSTGSDALSIVLT